MAGQVSGLAPRTALGVALVLARPAVANWWISNREGSVSGGKNLYPKGIVVSDDDFAAINITRADFHGEWNYTISPNNRLDRADDS
jgi:hypothetical protein